MLKEGIKILIMELNTAYIIEVDGDFVDAILERWFKLQIKTWNSQLVNWWTKLDFKNL